MAYAIPPQVFEAQIALVAGTSSVQILPAVNPTATWRIVAVWMGIDRLATGIVNLAVRDGGSLVAWRHSGAQLTGSPDIYFLVPEPGVQAPINTPMLLVANSSAAAGNAQAAVWAFVDNMT